MARIAVTGASGFIAGHLRRHMARAGADMVSISRRRFAALAGETRIISKDYEEGVLSAIRGADALVHLVGMGRQSARHTYEEINSGITSRMARLCRRAKVKRIIYLSGLGVSAGAQLGYFISKYRAEQAIKESGLEYVIYRPSYIVGRGDPLGRHLRRQAARGCIEIPGSGRYTLQPVYVGDVARLLYDSATGKKYRNKTLDLVGPERITFERYARLFLPGTRIKKTSLESAFRAALSGGDPGIDDLCIMMGGYEGDHRRLAAVSGIKFQPVTKLLEAGRFP